MSTETKPVKFDARPGAKLPNGATIIAVRPTGGRHGVVLALTTGYDPYVVWRLDLTTGDAYSGDYYRAIRHAVTAFEAR